MGRLLLALFLVCSAYAGEIQFTFQEGLKRLRVLETASEIEKGRQSFIDQHNLLLVKVHEARLAEESVALREQTKAPKGDGWWNDQPKQLLALKSEALKQVIAVKAMLEAKPPVRAPRFRDFKDIRLFLKEGPLEVGGSESEADSKASHDDKKARAKGGVLDSSVIKDAQKMISDFDRGGVVSFEDSIEMLDRIEDEIDYDALTSTERAAYKLIKRGLLAVWHDYRTREPILKEMEAFRRASPSGFRGFISSLGIKANGQVPKEKDLSSMFSIPQLQGDTKACASFAITSDMEGREKIPRLSAPYLYAVARAAEELGDVPLQNNLSAQLMKLHGVSDPKKLAAKMDKGLSGRGEIDALNFAFQTLSQNPIPSNDDFKQGFDDFIPRDLTAIANRKYRVGKVERFDEVLPASVYREILAANQPLMVGLARDGRTEQEGWIRPEYSGNFAHLVNVVGYGREMNPLNLEEEDYFLMRDSLTDVPMHYRMSARELIPFSGPTMRVSKVIVDP